MRTGKQIIQQTLSKMHVTVQPQNESSPVARPNPPMCPDCGDSGWLRSDAPLGSLSFGHLIRCSCKACEDAERLQKLSGLTETERKWKLGDIDINGRPQTKTMVEACARFLDHPYGSLTIYGTSGNAKTIALQACVNALVSVGVEAVYITAFDLISYVRSAFNDHRDIKSESDYGRILRFGTVRFLALDEFDKIKMTDWVEQEITDLIDRRYRLGLDNQSGTMIAMNGNPRDLPVWIYSRLSQGEIIENNDSDLRPYLKR